MAYLRAFFGVSRLPFLLLSVALVLNGAAAAHFEGHFDGLSTLIALLGLVFLHASVNAFNEASDSQTGIDRLTRPTPFSGGSGTIPRGEISIQGTYLFATFCALAGLLAGLWFLSEFGWSMVPLLAVGAICVLSYTHFLARLGLGEIAAGFGLGALPVVGTAFVQAGQIGWVPVAVSIPAFFMTFNLLLLNEFPDEQADRAGGRRNLVTIFGRRNAAFVYLLAAACVPISVLTFCQFDVLPPLSVAALLPSLFLVTPLRWAAIRPDSDVPVKALAFNVIWIILTNLSLAASLVIS